MKLKIPHLIFAALTVLAVNAKADTYYYWQSGFQGGGTLSGSFEATDINLDGQIVGVGGLVEHEASNDVTNFYVSLVGNSIIPDFTIDYAGLWGLVYDINGGPFLGDGKTGDVEGIGADGTNDGLPFTYESGQGPLQVDGGQISYNGFTITTPNLVMLSDRPITQDTYEQALESIPEPSTYAFMFGGLLSLSLWMRRNRKAQAA